MNLYKIISANNCILRTASRGWYNLQELSACVKKVIYMSLNTNQPCFHNNSVTTSVFFQLQQQHICLWSQQTCFILDALAFSSLRAAMTADASVSGSVHTWSGVLLFADSGRTAFLPAFSGIKCYLSVICEVPFKRADHQYIIFSYLNLLVISKKKALKLNNWPNTSYFLQSFILSHYGITVLCKT